jgi:hypothetical protein
VNVPTSGLLAHVQQRAPLGADGKSGSNLERGTLPDGTDVVLKHLQPEHDWIMQATRDDGSRLPSLWDGGQLGRMPAQIDHAILAIEYEEGHAVAVMRDVSDALFDGGRPPARADHRAVLDAATELHRAFRADAPSDGLCTLGDRFAMLSPQVCVPLADDHLVPRLAVEGWARLADVVPADVVEAIELLHADPAAYARALLDQSTTLLHGDLKQANLGRRDDRVVLIDWGTLSAWGPAEVDFAHYIAINSAWVGIALDSLLEDVRAAIGPQHDAGTMDLALLGAFGMLGWEKALGATADDEATRARERGALAWWVARTREVLERGGWSV